MCMACRQNPIKYPSSVLLTIEKVLRNTRRCWINFAAHNIVSEIEFIDIQNICDACDRMEKGDVRYRFVIDMTTLNFFPSQ